jgi:hypothetical protein
MRSRKVGSHETIVERPAGGAVDGDRFRREHIVMPFIKQGVTMKDAIGYLRVSTAKQGRSGLGLAAQRVDIEAVGTPEGFTLSSGIVSCRVTQS